MEAQEQGAGGQASDWASCWGQPDKMFIPRIYNQPSDNQNAFTFTRKQFPVRLCFSMTTNKSQGQSVKHVGLDLRSPVFTHGQFYVAVSRVTSVGNIKVILGEEDKECGI
jgi:hypothetical protein